MRWLAILLFSVPVLAQTSAKGKLAVQPALSLETYLGSSAYAKSRSALNASSSRKGKASPR
jgi:hypothetical protein